MDTVKRARELAAERNLSLCQLARKSGISHATIAQTERRGGQLKIDTIESICKALHITLSEFFAEA